MSSTEAWLFDDETPADGDDVNASAAPLSNCGVRGLSLIAPAPASEMVVVVAISPGCHSRRDPPPPPLSLNTYVCSPVAGAVSTSTAKSSATATLSRLDDPLPPRDRRFPNATAGRGGPGEPSFGGHGVLVGLSCGIRRTRGSACSGESSTRDARFLDDVGGLDDVDSDAASASVASRLDDDVPDDDGSLFDLADGLDDDDDDDDGPGENLDGRGFDVGGLGPRSSSGCSTA